jgi:hypothetical protein
MTDVAAMSLEARLGEAVSRSARYLPAEVAAEVAALFTPTNLAIMAVTLAVWAGSHLAGVGFIADIILLCLGVAVLGWTAVQLAGVLYDFAVALTDAKSEEDLDAAAQLFARAVLLAGVGTVSAVLLRGAAGNVRAAAAARRAPAPAPAPAPVPTPHRHWGDNFRITPARPDRMPPAVAAELTASARAVLAGENRLLLRSVGGEWSAAGTNATAGRSWWRGVDMSLARTILEGLRSGRPGPTVEGSIARYGFRPGSPNTAEVWVTDLHTLASRNPGATFEVDALGDLVLTTPSPNMMLYGVRRFRFDRRNPVQSYMELF